MGEERAASHVQVGVWMQAGQRKQVVLSLKALLIPQLDPSNVHAYFNRGISHEKRGDQRAAIDDFTACIRLDPCNAVAFYNRCVLESRCMRPGMWPNAGLSHVAVVRQFAEGGGQVPPSLSALSCTCKRPARVCHLLAGLPATMRSASLTRQVGRQLACVQSRPGAPVPLQGTAAQLMHLLLVTCFAITAVCGRRLLQAVVDYRRALDAEK